MTKPLLLIDASSYFFRAFHALPPLTNAKGQPTGAIYGVTTMIKRLITDYQPEQLAVVFDAKGKTFRDALYPAYKANRPPMPAALSAQFEPLLAMIKAMGWPLLLIGGVEADDVIGTLAMNASKKGQPVVISTGDKDMAQLVNAHVSLINTMTNQRLDEAGVMAKFGVKPSQIIDYLALMGDASDNVPGITKCGAKTAVKWLNTYHSLDNLVAHADEVTGKIGDYLREGLSQLALSKQLVTIKTDVELPLAPNGLTPTPPDNAALIQLTTEFEFKSWLKELLAQNTSNPTEQNTVEALPFSYEILTEQTALDAWINKVSQSSLLCIDTETTSLEPMDAELVGISMAIHPDHAIYIPLAHQDGSPQLERSRVLAQLKPLLENPAITKVGQNSKYDYLVFKNYAIDLQGIAFDTMLESYLLNSTATRHNMDALALKYLGYQTITYEEVAGRGAKQVRFDKVPVSQAAPYAAEDAAITLRLHHTLYPLLDARLKTVLQTIEIPLLTVLAEMESTGVLIDKATLMAHGIRLKTRINALEEEAIQLAGMVFNLNSPKQLQTILFETLQLPVITKTPKGQPSTAESVLQELAYQYRLPAVIIEYRGLAKLVSTYIDALPKRIHEKTGRVHTSYNQAVAATGRLSSSEPNLQNIPIRSEEGRLIRKAFIAPPEHVLLAADYSQIELRIMAHLSNDPSLLEAFAKGWDIHAATASELFSVALPAVTDEQRRRAKAVNFGLIYGMSAFGLAKQLGVERHDAQHYIDRYFERYPGVLTYMEQTRQQAREQGYVETLLGRRLHVPDINASNMMRRSAAERTAINAPMQGTAADIIKKAMLDVAGWLQTIPELGIRMIMQVHDELVFEVPNALIDMATTHIREKMEQTVKLAVPLTVSIGTGANWDEAH